MQELLGHESSVTTQSYIFVPSSDLTFIARKVRARRPQDVSNRTECRLIQVALFLS